jgi:hypothetical protein
MTTDEYLRDKLSALARERGYHSPTLRNGHLVVYRGELAVDYALEILEPLGLVRGHPLCRDLNEACRLMGLLPPAR